MDFSRIEQRVLELFPRGLPDANLESLFQLAQEEPGEFADTFVQALADAGIDLGLDLAPSPIRTQFTVLESDLPQATEGQLALIGYKVAFGILADPALQARFARWRELSDSEATDPESPAYDPSLDAEYGDIILELDDAVSALEANAYDRLQETSGQRFTYYNLSHVHSLPIYSFVLRLLEHNRLHALVDLYTISSGFLAQWTAQEGNVDIEVSYQGEHIPLSVPPEYRYFHGAVIESETAQEEVASAGETFAPSDTTDETTEIVKATETPPAIDLTNKPDGTPDGEGYQALDPEILNPKPSNNNAEEFKVPELPGYEATPYVEKLSENGGALPASTERFANASPREAAERMLSKFVRTHGSIHMIEPSVHVSEFGETVSYWPQVFSSDALPELGFFEAHFGYLSEFPVRLPDGEVEMMDLVELKATLQQFEGANTYFAGTPVVPGVVPMVFSPSFVPAPVASPGFVAPGMGLAPVW